MSVSMDEGIKRWTAKRKSALVVEIIQGKTTVAEVHLRRGEVTDRAPECVPQRDGGRSTDMVVIDIKRDAIARSGATTRATHKRTEIYQHESVPFREPGQSRAGEGLTCIEGRALQSDSHLATK